MPTTATKTPTRNPRSILKEVTANPSTMATTAPAIPYSVVTLGSPGFSFLGEEGRGGKGGEGSDAAGVDISRPLYAGHAVPMGIFSNESTLQSLEGKEKGNQCAEDAHTSANGQTSGSDSDLLSSGAFSKLCRAPPHSRRSVSCPSSTSILSPTMPLKRGRAQSPPHALRNRVFYILPQPGTSSLRTQITVRARTLPSVL